VPTLLASVLLWWQAGGNGAAPAPARADPNLQVASVSAPLDARTAYLLGYGLHRRAVELTGILLGAIGMLAVGLLDDKRELRPGVKFCAQFLVALVVAVSGARITLFVPNVLFHYAITILWILTVINAFNFLDN